VVGAACRGRPSRVPYARPRDPATLIGAVVTLAAVDAMAGWLPACRAPRMDPAEVLRSE
jgi:ABC-type lipoprotein release transport system permease subunit